MSGEAQYFLLMQINKRRNIWTDKLTAKSLGRWPLGARLLDGEVCIRARELLVFVYACMQTTAVIQPLAFGPLQRESSHVQHSSTESIAFRDTAGWGCILQPLLRLSIRGGGRCGRRRDFEILYP
jgi:hypothetical protein